MSRNRLQKRRGRYSVRFVGHWVVDTYSVRRSKIEKKIMESVQAQVKIEVGEWGQSNAAKKFIENLKNMAEENDVLFQEAQVKLDNS